MLKYERKLTISEYEYSKKEAREGLFFIGVGYLCFKLHSKILERIQTERNIFKLILLWVVGILVATCGSINIMDGIDGFKDGVKTVLYIRREDRKEEQRIKAQKEASSENEEA